jgi:hypothetical protein
MNFVFENIKLQKNLVTCPDINPSGIMRFTPSPVATTLIRHFQCRDIYKNIDLNNIKVFDNPYNTKNYIIATGVTHSPYDWTGPDGKGNGNCHFDSSRKNLFSYLNAKYHKDLSTGRAYLLLDQSHEGYHYDWLFDWFHNSCEQYNINPKQIIYITGNMDVERQYEEYCLANNKNDKLCVIGHAHFEQAVFTTYNNRIKFDNEKFPTFEQQLEYKKQNLTNIKAYNALQKRTRAHRMWLFKELFFNNLIKDGVVSMNSFDLINTYYDGKSMEEADYNQLISHLPILPPGIPYTKEELDHFADQDSGKYQMRLNDDVVLDTWVSVISEASFAEDTCFISEKTFKPITLYHPFIIYGNKYSLKYLRNLGYKTFHPFIDESYDELDSWQRLDAIVDSIRKITEIPLEDRIDWFCSMKDILNHNFEKLKENTLDLAPASYVKLIEYTSKN